MVETSEVVSTVGDQSLKLYWIVSKFTSMFCLENNPYTEFQLILSKGGRWKYPNVAGEHKCQPTP